MNSYTTQCVLHLNETVFSKSFTLTLYYTVQAFISGILPEGFLQCTDKLSSTPALFMIISRLKVFSTYFNWGGSFFVSDNALRSVFGMTSFSNAQIANGVVKCFVISFRKNLEKLWKWFACLLGPWILYLWRCRIGAIHHQLEEKGQSCASPIPGTIQMTEFSAKN